MDEVKAFLEPKNEVVKSLLTDLPCLVMSPRNLMFWTFGFKTGINCGGYD